MNNKLTSVRFSVCLTAKAVNGHSIRATFYRDATDEHDQVVHYYLTPIRANKLKLRLLALQCDELVSFANIGNIIVWYLFPAPDRRRSLYESIRA